MSIFTNIGKVTPVVKGTFSSTATYERLDMVVSGGVSYIAKSAVPAGQTPPNGTYWMPMLDNADATAAAAAAAINANNAAENADRAHSAVDLVAPAFDVTRSYKKGDYVIYQGNLYRFDYDHAPGNFSLMEAKQERIEVRTDGYTSPNLLDFDNIKEGYALNTTTGELYQYNGYYTSDFIPVEVATQYWQLSYSSDSFIYVIRKAGEVCYYNKDKTFISGFALNSNNYNITPPANTAFVRFSSPLTANSQLDMFGRWDIMRWFCSGYPNTSSLALQSWSFVPFGKWEKNAITIYKITDSYVNKGWRGYWSFKFGRIYYTDFDGTQKTFQFSSYFPQKYPSLISTDNSTVYDTFNMYDGDAFVFRQSYHMFIMLTSGEKLIEKDDVVIFAVKDDVPYGLLWDEYNSSLTFNQQRPALTTLPESIMTSIDSALENSGLLTAASRDEIFTFIHVSDNHHTGAYHGIQANLTGMAIKHLHSRLKFDAIFNTGDDILTVTTAASGLGSNNGKVALSNAINAYPVDDLVFAEGNHDRGIIPEQYITQNEYYNMVLRHWKDNENVHTVYPKSYYYRDYPKHKIRAVVLTLYNLPDNDPEAFYSYLQNGIFGYDRDQVNWLCDEALRVEAGWSVIILTHQAPVSTSEGNPGNGTGGVNVVAMRNLLESFRAGTSVNISSTSASADGRFQWTVTTPFAQQGPRTLIGVLSGHTHIDTIVKVGNINYDAICCGYIDVVEYGQGKPRGTRTAFTPSAVCFDIGTINLQTRVLTLFRCGFIPNGVSQIRNWSF
ncbi:MAG: metallophosphoesterase [Anaerolineaceae bacterium]|nr:metallophosphoesterase [Anaerolineaceae bacterium]